MVIKFIQSLKAVFEIFFTPPGISILLSSPQLPKEYSSIFFKLSGNVIYVSPWHPAIAFIPISSISVWNTIDITLVRPEKPPSAIFFPPRIRA